MKVLIFCVLLNQIKFNEPACILAVFPTPSISHQIVFRPLVHELARRGHEVTVITTDPAFTKDQAPSNLIEIDVHDISYNIWRQYLSSKDAKMDFFTQVDGMYRAFSAVFKAQITTDKVQDIILKKHGDFDLLLLEAFIPVALAFSNIFKVPIIQISSAGGTPYSYKAVGTSSYPLLYPRLLSKKSYNLTKWEIVEQIYNDWVLEKYIEPTEELNRIIPVIFGPDIPLISELQKNVDMLFLNVYPFWIKNNPLPPNVLYIGGIHKPPIEELSKNMQTFLDSSKNGVIYFSLGTNVKPSLLPRDRIKIFTKVFSEIHYDVIWKWDNDTLPEISENIKIFKWLPQPKVLQHPNVKLFITQGGLQSTDEAISAGIPLIGIPMRADQWYNVDKYVYLKIGMKLSLASLTEEQLREAIENVILDKSYRENIVKLRSITEDQPQSALERAIWWTEYVLRYGGAKHLKAASANISWTQYIEIEIILIVLFILLCGIVLIRIVFNNLKKYLQENLTMYKFKIM